MEWLWVIALVANLIVLVLLFVDINKNNTKLVTIPLCGVFNNRLNTYRSIVATIKLGIPNKWYTEDKLSRLANILAVKITNEVYIGISTHIGTDRLEYSVVLTKNENGTTKYVLVKLETSDELKQIGEYEND